MYWKELLIAGLIILTGILVWRYYTQQQQAATIGGGEVSEQKKEEPKAIVYELQGDDVESFVATTADGTTTAVLFIYAPWCGYCTQMAPELDKAAVAAPHCTWGKLDGDKFPELAKQLGATGFPHTLVFARGQILQAVPGAQKAEQLVEATKAA